MPEKAQIGTLSNEIRQLKIVISTLQQRASEFDCIIRMAAIRANQRAAVTRICGGHPDLVVVVVALCEVFCSSMEDYHDLSKAI